MECIPIYIIGFNNLFYIRNIVIQLIKLKCTNIFIIDNNSTHLPLLDYYRNNNDFKLIQMDQNYGHDIIKKKLYDDLPDLFVMVDPHLEFNVKLPENFMAILIELSNLYKTYKIGMALDISESEDFDPELRIFGESIRQWESKFWQKKIIHPKYELYDADIDNTFVLYNKTYKSNVKIRIAGNFTSKYLPWYIEKISDLHEIINESRIHAKKIYESISTNRTPENTDIFDHLKTLYKYALKCNSVIILGTNRCAPSWSFLNGILDNSENKKKYITDLSTWRYPEVDILESIAKKLLEYEFLFHKSLEYNLDKHYDITFIDEWHCYPEVKAQLEKYAPFTNKYIILHDTTIDEFISESIRCGHDIVTKSKESGYSTQDIRIGIMKAIDEFIIHNKNWIICKKYTYNNGLVILEKNRKYENLNQIIILMNKYQCDSIILCKYNDPRGIFSEIITSLKYNLIDMGIYCSDTNDININFNSNTLYIFFNMHIYTSQIDKSIKYIIYNFEQSGSIYITYPHYIEKMIDAIAVFDYSEFNKNNIEKRIKKSVTVIPFHYHPILTQLELNILGDEPIDILFYGALSERRMNYYQILSNTRFKVEFITDYSCFGDKLFSMLSKSKIVLNLHYYVNPSVLEQSRIIPLISNYKLVLSEKSDDTQQDKYFENIIVFIDESTIVSECINI